MKHFIPKRGRKPYLNALAIQNKDAAQKALSDAQTQVLNKYTKGEIDTLKYMTYMQMITFSFPPKMK